MRGFFHCAGLFSGLLSASSCGIAESSKGEGGDGDSSGEASGGADAGEAGSGGVGTGGIWTEENLPDCFSSFGLDRALLLQDLDEAEQATVCSGQEQMFSCLHPEDRICTYLGAIMALAGGEEALTSCRERESGCLAGTIYNPIEFTCRVFEAPGCPGTVGELETCFRDHLDDLAARPRVDWTCENATEVVDWMILSATDLPASCAAFDGCAL